MDKTRANIRTLFALLTGAAIGLGIWSSSMHLYGATEAWDRPHYLPFLLFGGIVGGVFFPNNYHALYVGMVFGQLIYVLSMVTDSAGLWPIGLAFLLILSSLAYLGAWIGAQITRSYLTLRRRQ